MGTHHDPKTGQYWAIADNLDAEDEALANQMNETLSGWSLWWALRPHFQNQPSSLTGEQRSRIAYYDDLLERL